jgi:hypothetical protein
MRKVTFGNKSREEKTKKMNLFGLIKLENFYMINECCKNRDGEYRTSVSFGERCFGFVGANAVERLI